MIYAIHKCVQSGRPKETFIVGDVHGCFNELMLLLKKAGYSPKEHRLILVGDLINKGPDSFKTLNWVRKTETETVIGNHEMKFIEAIEFDKVLPPLLKELREQMGQKLYDWIEWIKSWPVYIETEDFLVIHGGVVPGEHPGRSELKYLLNIRCWDSRTKSIHSIGYPAWHDFYNSSKLVVYGHWARQGLKIRKNSIGLDTGCVYGGRLTGVWLPPRTIVQIEKQ